jgi:4-aminobutyrate aminotransferase-like enzyme
VRSVSNRESDAELPSGFSSEPVARIVGGDGVRFRLADGRAVLDASNTGGPFGHRHPRMRAALREALNAPVVNEAWAWVGRERAAEDLQRIAFAEIEDWFGGVRFCLSGSEANDLALSLAQALTGRSALATRERAYHGASGLARELTTQPQWHGGLSFADARVAPVPRTTEVRVLPAPLGERIGPTPPDPAGDLRRVAGSPVALDDAAAVIVDYTQGGIYHSPGHQDGVARRACEAGALWIADEVVNGFGRAGAWFAFQRGTALPDIVTLGKGLGGGAAPVGAVVVSRAVADAMTSASWQTGGTFRAHPLGMAAISASLAIVADADLPARVEALDGLMLALLRDVAARHPSVRRIDGRGLHWTIEIEGGDWRDWTGASAAATPAQRLQAAMLAAGVLVSTSGEETSVFLAPPLVATEAELREIVEKVDQGLQALGDAG